MNKPLVDRLLGLQGVRIVMASKYLDADGIRAFYEAGIRDFGESRVEHFLKKAPLLEDLPFRRHFLGTLQTKKVKKIINRIDCLHSLDRPKLAKEIEKRRHEPLDCFVQVNISAESQKHGVAPAELENFLDHVRDLEKVRVIGLMGMAELTDDEERIREQFALLRRLRDEARTSYPDIRELSMGMSGDYELALAEGATILRLGRILLREAFDEQEER